MASAITLSRIGLRKPFHLFTDASDSAIGYVLKQGEQMEVVACGSKTLNDCQRRWSTSEKELFCDHCRVEGLLELAVRGGSHHHDGP